MKKFILLNTFMAMVLIATGASAKMTFVPTLASPTPSPGATASSYNTGFSPASAEKLKLDNTIVFKHFTDLAYFPCNSSFCGGTMSYVYPELVGPRGERDIPPGKYLLTYTTTVQGNVWGRWINLTYWHLYANIDTPGNAGCQGGPVATNEPCCVYRDPGYAIPAAVYQSSCVVNSTGRLRPKVVFFINDTSHNEFPFFLYGTVKAEKCTPALCPTLCPTAAACP